MAAGAVAIALSSATEREHSSWRDAAHREGERYGVEHEYVRAGMEGKSFGASSTWQVIHRLAADPRHDCSVPLPRLNLLPASHGNQHGLGRCPERGDAGAAGRRGHRPLAHHALPVTFLTLFRLSVDAQKSSLRLQFSTGLQRRHHATNSRSFLL